MTAEQLEELRKLASLPPDSPTAKVMASLARRVIAAEKLVEALDQVEIWGEQGSEVIPDVISYVLSALTAYHEASK